MINKKIKSKKKLNKEILDGTKEFRKMISVCDMTIDDFYKSCYNHINNGKSTHPLNWLTLSTSKYSDISKKFIEEKIDTPGIPKMIEAFKSQLCGKVFSYLVTPHVYSFKKFQQNGLAVMDFWCLLEQMKKDQSIPRNCNYQGSLFCKDEKFFLNGFHGGIKIPLTHAWIINKIDA